MGEGEFYLEQEGQNPPLNLSVPEGPSASAPSWRSLSAAEAVAISEIETGLMEAVDLPVATLDYDAHWAQDTSSEPAPVPTRFSLKERLEGGPTSDAEERGDQDGAALQAPGEDTGGTEAEELAAGPYDYREDFSPSAQSDEAPSSAASAASSAALLPVGGSRQCRSPPCRHRRPALPTSLPSVRLEPRRRPSPPAVV